MAKKRKKKDHKGFSLTETMLHADASVIFGHSTPFAKPIKEKVGEAVGDFVHYMTGQDDFADAAERGAALAAGLAVNKALLDPVGAGKTVYDATRSRPPL